MRGIIKKLLFALFKDRVLTQRLKNNDNKIALTFDDGPYRDHNDELLSILKENNALASFFLLGSEVEKNMNLAMRIKEAGHDIGNHSFSHRKVSEIGIDKYIKEIAKTNDLIEASTGEKTFLFRPPFGDFNFSLLKFILRKNMILAGWTIDSHDSYIKDTKKLIDNFSRIKIRNGDIILFHEDYPTTIQAMPEIIDILLKQGFKLVTISELIR
jgi:peptidoglycan/xylan/chitin deacetylase (PgdA/CDA1 family)